MFNVFINILNTYFQIASQRQSYQITLSLAMFEVSLFLFPFLFTLVFQFWFCWLLETWCTFSNASGASVFLLLWVVLYPQCQRSVPSSLSCAPCLTLMGSPGSTVMGAGGTGVFGATFRSFVEGMTNTYSFPCLEPDMQITPPLWQKAKKN